MLLLLERIMKSHWEKYTDEKSISSLPPPPSPFPYSDPPLHTPPNIFNMLHWSELQSIKRGFFYPQAAVVQKGARPQRITIGLNSVCGSHPENKITVNNSRTWFLGRSHRNK